MGVRLVSVGPVVACLLHGYLRVCRCPIAGDRRRGLVVVNRRVMTADRIRKARFAVEYRDPEWLRAAYDELGTLDAVAEQTPVTAGAVRHMMVKFGIERNPDATDDR